MFAYLDPGTGSLALQLWIAGVLSGVYVLKTLWRRITHKVAGVR
jgi:hypothetical protein